MAPISSDFSLQCEKQGEEDGAVEPASKDDVKGWNLIDLTDGPLEGSVAKLILFTGSVVSDFSPRFSIPWFSAHLSSVTDVWKNKCGAIS